MNPEPFLIAHFEGVALIVVTVLGLLVGLVVHQLRELAAKLKEMDDKLDQHIIESADVRAEQRNLKERVDRHERKLYNGRGH